MNSHHIGLGFKGYSITGVVGQKLWFLPKTFVNQKTKEHQVSTFIARTAVADSPKRSRLAIAIVSALALVMALLNPALPANAAGSGSITSVSPTSGPVGTTVTISGDVAGVTSVLFGTVAGGSLTVAGNGQSLTVSAPTQTTGSNPYSIKIVKTDGSVTLNSAYTYRAVTPVVSSVSPANGSATGYNTVTISGSNFTGTTNVKFGTVAAVSFSVLSDSRITAVVPAGTAGAAVRVTVEGRGTSVNAVNYTYKSSTCVAGTYLTTKFGFNSSALTKAQKRKIRETADEFVTLGCEEVNLVKYIGKRKGASATYKAYLTLQNKRANAVLTVLEKRLTTWSVPIVVTEVKRANQKSQAKKASPDALVSYRNVLLRIPAFTGIESLYPNVGSTTGTTALGTTVVITGKGFTNLAPTGAVRFGSAASPSYTVNATGTMITATVPSGLAGVTNITVQTGVAGTSTAKLYSRQFTYQAAPTVTSVNNSAGSIIGGDTVTVTGTNFSNVTAVRFGNVNAVSFVVNSSTSITAVSPSGSLAVSPVSITVVTGGGLASGASFAYRSAPHISSITNNEGPFEGGVDVVIAGTGLLTATTASSVKFGGVASETVPSSVTDVSLTARPAPVARTAVGFKSVSVTTSYGEAVVTNGYKQGVTVTFNYNGATSQAETARLTAIQASGSGSIVLPSPAPLRTGWTFDGWWESSVFAGSALTGPNYAVESSKTIYAKWVATVTYDYDGATGGNATVSQPFVLGGTAINLPVPTKTGNTFAGWFLTEARTGSAVGATFTPTANTTLYAKWTPNP